MFGNSILHCSTRFFQSCGCTFVAVENSYRDAVQSCGTCSPLARGFLIQFVYHHKLAFRWQILTIEGNTEAMRSLRLQETIVACFWAYGKNKMVGLGFCRPNVQWPKHLDSIESISNHSHHRWRAFATKRADTVSCAHNLCCPHGILWARCCQPWQLQDSKVRSHFTKEDSFIYALATCKFPSCQCGHWYPIAVPKWSRNVRWHSFRQLNGWMDR